MLLQCGPPEVGDYVRGCKRRPNGVPIALGPLPRLSLVPVSLMRPGAQTHNTRESSKNDSAEPRVQPHPTPRPRPQQCSTSVPQAEVEVQPSHSTSAPQAEVGGHGCSRHAPQCWTASTPREPLPQGAGRLSRAGRTGGGGRYYSAPPSQRCLSCCRNASTPLLLLLHCS